MIVDVNVKPQQLFDAESETNPRVVACMRKFQRVSEQTIATHVRSFLQELKLPLKGLVVSQFDVAI